ncbi:hypothetical protein N7G274_006237 [Stereocaulon virgatum]|uniref:A-kinase anchor protein 7-like phosphoesterase domain-containing protein n=1 Tax=Stereocaulon virgatum TaxID=373712 RepID=A0ABR4A5L6_9LECA
MPPKPQTTHFLCLPLITATSRPQFHAALQRFASEVTSPNEASETQLPPKAIRPVGALHLTLGVMSLLTPERLDAACTMLREYDITSLLRTSNDASPAPLSTVTFTGLHAMQSPTRTSSLYTAPTTSAAPLLPFCTTLRQAFTEAGFLIPEDRQLKLHATIVNTIYAREAKSGKKRWGKGSGKFDATSLIERYKDFEWAKDFSIEKVAICEMGAKVVVEGDKVVDQVYTEVASAPLPLLETEAAC